MVSSNGVIYKFLEGVDGQRVDFETYPTHLGKDNDVEGLCYDPKTNSLLLALKGNPGNGLGKDKKSVYSFSLKTKQLSRNPRFVLDKKHLQKYSKYNDFKPSGIARHPKTSNFFIIAANGNLMIEINPEGDVIEISNLDRKLHKQAEGISFYDEKILFISDEGKKNGKLTKYILE